MLFLFLQREGASGGGFQEEGESTELSRRTFGDGAAVLAVDAKECGLSVSDLGSPHLSHPLSSVK